LLLREHSRTLAQKIALSSRGYTRAMGENEQQATGVGAALLLDTLLSLDIDDPFALTPAQQIAAIEHAASEGRLDAAQVAALREAGAPPPVRP
jgi:hypothetical protein